MRVGDIGELRQDQGEVGGIVAGAGLDQRAEKMPGMPPSTSTQSPESSATDGSRVNAAMARAFSSAFSANVSPVSATSGARNSSSPVRLTGTPAADKDPAQLRELMCVVRGEHQRRGAGQDRAPVR